MYKNKLNIKKTEKELEKVTNLEKTVVEDEDEEEEEVASLAKGVDANNESLDPESASPGKKIPYPKKKKGKNGGLEDDEMFPSEGRDDIFPKEEGIGLFDED